jgi:hypothetical protein
VTRGDRTQLDVFGYACAVLRAVRADLAVRLDPGLRWEPWEAEMIRDLAPLLAAQLIGFADAADRMRADRDA